MGACQQPTRACGLTFNDSDFVDDVNKKFATKYEKILDILSRLRLRADKYGDEIASSQLAWVSQTLQNGNLHEPEFSENNTNGMNDDKMNILVNYTNIQNKIGLKYDALEVDKKIEEIKKNTKPRNYAGLIKKFKRSISTIVMALEKKEELIANGCTPEQVLTIATVLSKIGEYEFNIFELDKCAGKNSIYFLLELGIKRFGVMKYLNEKKLTSFCKALGEGYNREVLYHNDLHGADVCQTTIVQFEKGNWINKWKLGDIDVIAVIVAAAAHDYKHNGFNNNYQINQSTEIALTYNDNSVLENWHVSQTFKTLLKEENNFLEKFSPEEYRHIRRRMIDCIWSTDMAKHALQKSLWQAMIKANNIKNGENVDSILVGDPAKKFENQQLILSQIVHTADLSNPAKIPAVSDKWTELVYREFFSQGDIEKKLNVQISPWCDRSSVSVAKSQVGFIQYVVLPQLEMMWEWMPEIIYYKDWWLSNWERYQEKQKDEVIKM